MSQFFQRNFWTTQNIVLLVLALVPFPVVLGGAFFAFNFLGEDPPAAPPTVVPVSATQLPPLPIGDSFNPDLFTVLPASFTPLEESFPTPEVALTQPVPSPKPASSQVAKSTAKKSASAKKTTVAAVPCAPKAKKARKKTPVYLSHPMIRRSFCR